MLFQKSVVPASSQDPLLPELWGKAVVHWSSLVTGLFSADMTYAEGLLTQQVQGETQTQAGAHKKPGEAQREHSLLSAENATHRK